MAWRQGWHARQLVVRYWHLPPGTVASNGTCRQCKGGRVVINGPCECPQGTVAWPKTAADCVKGNRIVCRWRVV
jgi:hypothetical protein